MSIKNVRNSAPSQSSTPEPSNARDTRNPGRPVSAIAGDTESLRSAQGSIRQQRPLWSQSIGGYIEQTARLRNSTAENIVVSTGGSSSRIGETKQSRNAPTPTVRQALGSPVRPPHELGIPEEQQVSARDLRVEEILDRTESLLKAHELSFSDLHGLAERYESALPEEYVQTKVRAEARAAAKSGVREGTLPGPFTRLTAEEIRYVEQFTQVLQATLNSANRLAPDESRLHHRHHDSFEKLNYFISQQCAKKLIRSAEFGIFVERWRDAETHGAVMEGQAKSMIAASATVMLMDGLNKTNLDKWRHRLDRTKQFSVVGALLGGAMEEFVFKSTHDKKSLHPSIRKQTRLLEANFVSNAPTPGMSWARPQVISDVSQIPATGTFLTVRVATPWLERMTSRLRDRPDYQRVNNFLYAQMQSGADTFELLQPDMKQQFDAFGHSLLQRQRDELWLDIGDQLASPAGEGKDLTYQVRTRDGEDRYFQIPSAVLLRQPDGEQAANRAEHHDPIALDNVQNAIFSAVSAHQLPVPANQGRHAIAPTMGRAWQEARQTLMPAGHPVMDEHGGIDLTRLPPFMPGSLETVRATREQRIVARKNAPKKIPSMLQSIDKWLGEDRFSKRYRQEDRNIKGKILSQGQPLAAGDRFQLGRRPLLTDAVTGLFGKRAPEGLMAYHEENQKKYDLLHRKIVENSLESLINSNDVAPIITNLELEPLRSAKSKEEQRAALEVLTEFAKQKVVEMTGLCAVINWASTHQKLGQEMREALSESFKSKQRDEMTMYITSASTEALAGCFPDNFEPGVRMIRDQVRTFDIFNEKNPAMIFDKHLKNFRDMVAREIDVLNPLTGYGQSNDGLLNTVMTHLMAGNADQAMQAIPRTRIETKQGEADREFSPPVKPLPTAAQYLAGEASWQESLMQQGSYKRSVNRTHKEREDAFKAAEYAHNNGRDEDYYITEANFVDAAARRELEQVKKELGTELSQRMIDARRAVAPNVENNTAFDVLHSVEECFVSTRDKVQNRLGKLRLAKPPAVNAVVVESGLPGHTVVQITNSTGRTRYLALPTAEIRSALHNDSSGASLEADSAITIDFNTAENSYRFSVAAERFKGKMAVA